MVKAEWGAKRICQECGTKFYDMRRAEIVCPKCEAVFKTTPPKPKRAQPAAKDTAVVAKPTAEKPHVVAKLPASGGDGDEPDDLDEVDEIEDIDDIEDVVSDEDDDDDDDEDMIEDTSDLGDDDDDMAEVIQKPAPPEEI